MKGEDRELERRKRRQNWRQCPRMLLLETKTVSVAPIAAPAATTLAVSATTIAAPVLDNVETAFDY